jgi:plasmid stabilization system protein ParE
MLVRKLVHAAERLATFPASGRIVPGIGDESLREVIHRNYRIVYFHLSDEDKVEVLTVFHASRQFGALPSGGDE